MKEKKYTWYKVADSVGELDFLTNKIVEVEVKNKTICIALQDDHLFAFSSKCPHASGRLADGFIDGKGDIVCPLHRYKFNIQNGRNTSGEGFFLKTYPIERRNEGIFVGIEENNGFNW